MGNMFFWTWKLYLEGSWHKLWQYMALFTAVGFTSQEKVDLKTIRVICLLNEYCAAGGRLDNPRKCTLSKPSRIWRRRKFKWMTANMTKRGKWFFFSITFTALLEISSSTLENSWQMDFVIRLLPLSINVHQHGETLSLLVLYGILLSFSSDLTCSHGAEKCCSVNGLLCWLNVCINLKQHFQSWVQLKSC